MYDFLMKVAYEAGAIAGLAVTGLIGFVIFRWWTRRKDAREEKEKVIEEAKKLAKAELVEGVMKRRGIDPLSEWEDEVSGVKRIGTPGVDYQTPAQCKYEMDRMMGSHSELASRVSERMDRMEEKLENTSKETSHKLDVVISSQHQLAREFQNGIHEAEDRMRSEIKSELRDHVIDRHAAIKG